MKNEDLEIDEVYKITDSGGKVKLIQEWLNLHNIHIAIDGSFGFATERAVKQFQRTQGNLEVDGIVGKKTFKSLIFPMMQAIRIFHKFPHYPGDFRYLVGKSNMEGMVFYAREHLLQGPREVGGENCGPWVRLYMDGYEGNDYPWCAGFVSYILEQVYKEKIPVVKSFSVDAIVNDAIKKDIFYKEENLYFVDRIKKIKPGSLWILRKLWGDWVHIGIVIEVQEDTFTAIEGNTNDRGSREGIEVSLRIRSFSRKDFIIFKD